MILSGDMSLSLMLCGDMDLTQDLDGEFGTFQKVTDVEQYRGDTDVTPSDHVQVLHTSGLMLNEDIVINPVPDNYGRIAWNGSYLTVY